MNGTATMFRDATAADLSAVGRILAPHIAEGSVLPRPLSADDLIVAVQAGELVGVVALTPVAADTAELGSLVATRRGQGLGRALVEAAMTRAARQGWSHVMALTSVPGFFESCGFRASASAPWRVARRQAGLPSATALRGRPVDAAAARAKSSTCLACDRLTACRQVMLVRPTRRRARRAG